LRRFLSRGVLDDRRGAEKALARVRLLTTRSEDGGALGEALSRDDGLLVICLCAAWCYVCNDFRPVLARLALADGANRYLWLDIEDDAAFADGIEVDDFPTLAVFRGGEPLFFGVSRPRQGAVAHTLAALADPGARPGGVPEAVARLPGALAARARAEL
jgi:thioredoxin reductase (NADPH)